MDAVEPAGLDQVLDGAVTADGVRWEVVRARRGLLSAYVARLAEVDAKGLDRPAAMAFWIDAYNALTLDVVAGAGSIASIRDLDGGHVWTTRHFPVAGQSMTLDEIENKARSYGDPRVHAALNCASKGCAPLAAKAYRSASLDADLDAAAHRWARTTAVHVDGKNIGVSPVFQWYAGDFAALRGDDLPNVEGDLEAAVWFLTKYVDDDTRARLTDRSSHLAFASYDWALNQSR
jgi:hypothetical protein